MFDEPGLGCTKLLWINEDETPRLSKGLQNKCCQPTGRRDGGGGMTQIKMGEGERKGKQIRGERYQRSFKACAGKS